MHLPLAGSHEPLQRRRPYSQNARLYRPMPDQRDQDIEFGRFRILLRRRELLADGSAIKLGTRAFDVLLVLIEAGGSLVAKADLLEHVWPGIVVSQENLKVQISELRRALGKDRDLVRTEFGRGYRFTGVARRSTHAASEAEPTFGNARRSSTSEPGSLEALALRLTALEMKLSEVLNSLAASSRPDVDKFRDHRSCTDLVARRRLPRRRGGRPQRVSGEPRRLADWVAGG
jgi:DNA-binding winged helix-turn-helix (wHTH) protein